MKFGDRRNTNSKRKDRITMNAYDVFLYMKKHYRVSGQVPDIDELVREFPKLGILEIMKGERMFADWLGDVSA